MQRTTIMESVLLVLECLTTHNQLAMPDLEKRTGIPSAKLQPLLQLMEKRGYIRRAGHDSYCITHPTDVTGRSHETACMIIDHDGLIKHANHAAMRFLGYDDVMDVIGRRGREFIHDPSETHTALNELAVHKTWNGILHARHSEGTILPLKVCANSVFSENTNHSTVVSFIPITVTEQPNPDAENLLATGLAHDFNNMLGVILGYVSLLKEEINESNTADMLNDIEIAAEQASILINRVFNLAGTPERKNLNIREVMTAAIKICLKNSKITPSTSITPDLWQIHANETDLFRVFLNILINARHAMNNCGQMSIHADNILIGPDEKPPLREGPHVRIVISDNGTGIPKATLDQIFKPHFTTKKRGTGLGLFVTHSIITSLNGHIEAASEAGSGARFIIHLPALN